jgi:glycosyl transferase family 25
MNIYVINLKRNPERWINVQSQFKKFNITNYIRKDAVDGSKIDIVKYLSPLAKYILSKGRILHREIPSKGGIGCYLSHYEIWKEIIKNNLEYAIIMEDDIVISENPKKYLENLPKDFDIAYLGYCDMYNVETKEYNKYWNISSGISLCTHAYVISKKAC